MLTTTARSNDEWDEKEREIMLDSLFYRGSDSSSVTLVDSGMHGIIACGWHRGERRRAMEERESEKRDKEEIKK
jgi:hypothetical protein